MEDGRIDETSRPRFLNPLAIRLPVGAVASILHRISGALLFLALLPAAWLFSLSLAGPEEFAEVRAFFSSLPAKGGLALLMWAFLHHFFAGVRFLLLDAGTGIALPVARRMAWLALLAAPVVTILVFVLGWGA